MSENQALPTVKVEIGGKEFILHYSIYAFAKLKKVAKINALKGEVDYQDPDHLLYFLWAGLISEHPELDGDMIDGKPDKALASALRQIGTALTIPSLNSIAARVKAAFNSATGMADEKSGGGEASPQEKKR